MIHGIVQNGAILPLDPLPADWSDGRQLVIEAAPDEANDQRAEIERWYSNLVALGGAQYELGEREAIEGMMAQADREAKEYVRRSWGQFEDGLLAGHQSPERPAEP